MQITDHQLIDGATTVDLPHLPSPATVTAWRVPAAYRANGLFVAVKVAGGAQEVPACDYAAPEFTAELPAHAGAVLAAAVQALQVAIVTATQGRLDGFAQTRGYDNIKSVCGYVGCSVPRFATEGAYCRDKMAGTWETLYTLLGEVQGGTRPMPTGFADIEPLLPVLEWPA